MCGRVLRTFTLSILFALLSAVSAQAQNYPSRPIHLLIGYSAGGSSDVAARMIAPVLSAQLGQPVIIDNRPGAAGTLASNILANAEPNGYTLLMVTNATQTVAPHIQKSLAYDPLKGHTPISSLVGSAYVLLVNKDSPIKSIGEFVARAKTNPVELPFGSPGTGSLSHLSFELLQKITGIRLMHVPYKGNAPAMVALIAGEVSIISEIIGGARGHITSGNLRPLAVTTAHRNRMLPDVPTMIEAGVPGFNIAGWFALQGPPGLPAPIVSRLNAAVRAALADPHLTKQLQESGYDVTPSTPDELAAKEKAEYEMWGGVTSGLVLSQ